MKTTILKNIAIITICLLSMKSNSQETKEVCDCPEPNKYQFQDVCDSIYERARYDGPLPFSFRYQLQLFRLACIDTLKDTPEEAKIKMQNFWNKYRELFTCDNYIDSTATDKNLAKFCMERGFTLFVSEAVKKYQLDLNFTDKDGQTLLDYITEEIDFQKSYGSNINEGKINEFKRLYDLLRKKRCKTR